MTEGINEGVSDWEAMRQFRALGTDAERMEQLFMTALTAARHSRESASDIIEVKALQKIANGRTSKLEMRWIQGAAVMVFVLTVIPILLTVYALWGGK